MIADLAAEIAGEDVDVTTLLVEGVDPHTYQPTGADIRKLTEADAVLYNGLFLEGAMAKDLEKLAARTGRVFAVGETVSQDRLRTPPDFEGHPDPHIWMDVSLWAETVPAIVSALKEVDPDHTTGFDQRASALQAKLERLDTYIKETVATIPKPQRHLVTAHDAFGYFAIAYDIRVSSVQGVSTESEAGLEDVQNLVDLIVNEKIPAIFFESSVTNRNVAAILEGARAKGAQVADGGELFSDSAGAKGTWEGTYFGMMDHNARTLTEALGGTVPEGGFRSLTTSPTPSSTSKESAAPATE